MINLLRNRRSVRKFLSKKIETKKIELIKESLLRSPSSRNKKQWEFIIVDDLAIIKELSQSKEHGSQFLAAAPLAIVICGVENNTDVWIEDCSIASIILQLIGESIGLGSCWIQIRNRMHNNYITAEKYIQTLLNMPNNLRIESIIAIGYPDEEKIPVPYSELPFEKIKTNKYENTKK